MIFSLGLISLILSFWLPNLSGALRATTAILWGYILFVCLLKGIKAGLDGYKKK
jgi:hypothetical protein